MNDVTTSDIRGMITESHIHAAAKGLYSCIRRTPTFRLCRGEKKCALYTRIYGMDNACESGRTVRGFCGMRARL